MHNLRKKNDIRILLADKTKQFVIVDEEAYQEKVEATLSELNCVEIEIDPTDDLKTGVLRLKSNNILPEAIRNKCYVPIYPSPPKLFVKVKVHKQNKPFRPIVDKTRAPTYYLEKALANYLKPLFLPNKHTLESTQDFLKHISGVQVPAEARMFSLDVVSLYPNTPISVAIEIVLQLLEKKLKMDSTCLEIIKHAITLATYNYFMVNKTLYEQRQGAPMGSPLSMLLAEIILQNIEAEVLPNLQYKPFIYLRYVDDVFLIWAHNNEELKLMVEKMNNSYPTINFTIEEELNKELPFLDINIRIVNSSLVTSIYRKPTFIESCITRCSSHPYAYKKARFFSYLRRAYLVCTEANDLEQEVKSIREMCYNAGFDDGFFNAVDERVKKNLEWIPGAQKEKGRKFVKIPYIPSLAKLMYKYFKEKDFKIAYEAPLNISRLIVRDRDRKILTGGVYKVPVKVNSNNEEVVKVYIGETIRKLSKRISEHKSDAKKFPPKTALAKIIQEENAVPAWDEAEILCAPNTREQLHISEAINIYKYKNIACNTGPGRMLSYAWRLLIDEHAT